MIWKNMVWSYTVLIYSPLSLFLQIKDKEGKKHNLWFFIQMDNIQSPFKPVEQIVIFRIPSIPQKQFDNPLIFLYWSGVMAITAPARQPLNDIWITLIQNNTSDASFSESSLELPFINSCAAIWSGFSFQHLYKFPSLIGIVSISWNIKQFHCFSFIASR